MKDDYYALLGLNPNAGAREIRSAFIKKAKQHHPDTGADTASMEHFKKLNEAYRVLSDPVKKSEYDILTAKTRNMHIEETSLFSSSTTQHRSVHPFTHNSSGYAASFHDIEEFSPAGIEFKKFINRIIRVGGSFTREYTIGIRRDLALSGGQIHIPVGITSTCPFCGNTTGVDIFLCVECKGRKEITRQFVFNLTIPPDSEEGSRIRYDIDFNQSFTFIISFTD